jgi:hypothetical protein
MTKKAFNLDQALDRFMRTWFSRERKLQVASEMVSHPGNSDIHAALKTAGFFDAQDGESAWRNFAHWANQLDVNTLDLPPERRAIAQQIVTTTKEAFEVTKEAFEIEGEILRNHGATHQSKAAVRALMQQGRLMVADLVKGYKNYEHSGFLGKAMDALKADMHVTLNPLADGEKPPSLIEAYFRHEPPHPHANTASTKPMAETPKIEEMPKGLTRNRIIGSVVAAAAAAGVWMLLTQSSKNKPETALTR